MGKLKKTAIRHFFSPNLPLQAPLRSLWKAVFADVGVAVLAILNAIRIMKAK
jgi:hypothetical protein